MRLRRIIPLACLALIFCLIPFPSAAEDFTNALRAYLQQCVHAEIPNGCIVVGLVDEHGTRIVSCGTLDNGTDQEANGDTVFALHSLTGTFTYLLMQDLVDRGEMKWDDPVAKYLPKSVHVPTHNGKPITLRHLVTETSGLPNFTDKLSPKRADDPTADFTVEKMYAFVSGSQLSCDPGTKHFHGGVDKALLGQAMALKTGTNYETLVVERICRPLRMDSTRFTLTPELKSRLASEHNQLGYVIPSRDRGVFKPLAGLFSTANDLLKFISAFDLTPSSLTPFLQSNLACFPSREGSIARTGGGVFGRRAYACFDHTRRRGAVILSTSADLTRDFGDFLLESEWQSERRPTEAHLSSQLYDAYVGQYRPAFDAASRGFNLWPFSRHEEATNSQSHIGIHRAGDRLFAQVIGSRSWPLDALLPSVTAELLPQSETRFFERLSGKPVTFSRDARRKVTGLTMQCQGKAFSYKKLSDLPPKAPEPAKPRVAIKLAPKLLDACVGRYELPPKPPFTTGGKVRIWREGDQLLGQVWGENAIRGAFDIYAESETNFFLKTTGAQLTFIKNDQGEVTSLIHHSAGVGVPDSVATKLKD